MDVIFHTVRLFDVQSCIMSETLNKLVCSCACKHTGFPPGKNASVVTVSLSFTRALRAGVSTFWHHLLKRPNKEPHFKPHCQLMTAEAGPGQRLMRANAGCVGLFLM